MGKRKSSGDARDGGGGGGGGGPSKRKFARGGTGHGFIHGPGIFVSCTRGKEHRAATDLIEFLEEIVSRNYPDVEVVESVGGAGGEDQAAKEEAQRKLAHRALDEDDMDALLNGEVASAVAPSTSASKVNDANGEEMERTADEDGGDAPATKAKPPIGEDDVEAQIRAELAQLRNQSSATAGNRGSREETRGKGKKDSGQKEQARFKIVDTGVECLRFVSVARPLDPIALVHHLLSDVERTGSARSRFVQRLTPVTSTHMATEEQLVDVATKELPPRFSSSTSPSRSKATETVIQGSSEKSKEAKDETETDSTDNKDEPKTFKIEVRIRNHQTLRRDDVIRNVADVVSEACGSQHRANLTSPDLVIVVEVFKSIFGIGVLKDYERFRRYNVLELARKVNGDDEEGRDPTSSRDQVTSRTALATSSSASAAAAAGGAVIEEVREGKGAAEQT